MDFPPEIVIGRQKRLRKSWEKVVADFFTALSYIVYELHVVQNGIEDMFGTETFKIAEDGVFRKHVVECTSIARKMLKMRRLYAFEVSWNNSNDEQLFAVRVLITEKGDCCGQEASEYEVTDKLCSILKEVKKIRISKSTRITMDTTRIRPRIRLLARVSKDGTKFVTDNSTYPDHQLTPIANALELTPNRHMCIYAHQK